MKLKKFLHPLFSILLVLSGCYLAVRNGVTKAGEGIALEQQIAGTNSLNEQLRGIVNSYMEKHPYLSLNGFAKNSGVSATTLRRIVNDVTKTEPAPHTILNIISYVTKERKLTKLLDSVDGAIGDTLKKCFQQYTFEQTPHSFSSDLNAILEDYYYYLIYKLAANKSGTNQIEICEILGNLGREKLNDLIGLGIIDSKADGRLYACDPNFSLDISTAKKHLPELVKFYKPEYLDKGENIFYSLSESMNEKGIQKIKDILREAAKDIHKVMSQPELQGNKPYFAIVLSDTLNLPNDNHEVLQ